MRKWLASVLSLLAFALGAVGCGDDEEEDGGGARTSTEQPADTGPATAADTGPTAPRETVRVGMKDIQYVPKAVKVKAGGTVRWTNGDSVTHTVTKQGGPGPRFDSGNMEVGATFEQKFDRPGKVDYLCTIHPTQTGTVTVE